LARTEYGSTICLIRNSSNRMFLSSVSC